MAQRIIQRHRKVSINAIASFCQVIVVGICYFFLYKYLLKTLGAKELGLWSLILASSSVASIGQLGIGGSVVKFVAAGDANKDLKKIITVVHTGLLTIIVFVGLLSLILYFALPRILKSVVTADLFPLALQLIPLSLSCLVLSTCASVFVSTIEGIQFIYIRNLIIAFLTILYFLLVVLFVPHYGLLGVAYAQIIQASLMLILNMIVVYIKVPGFGMLRIKLQKEVFKELFSYGLNVQVMSLCGLLFDPITKYFLSRFGDLSITGYYEMANKLITQMRAMIVSTMQVIVPAISNAHEKGFTNIKQLFLKWFPYLFFVTIILITYIIGLADYISVIWIGKVEHIFSYILVCISAGWFFNIISAYPYFINMGTGILKWNVISLLTLATFNVICCYVFGRFLGGYYVVFGPAFALIAAAVVLFWGFCRQNEIKIKELFSRNNLIIFLVAFTGIIVSYFFFRIAHDSLPFIMLLFINILFITLLLYFNPVTIIMKSDILYLVKRN